MLWACVLVQILSAPPPGPPHPVLLVTTSPPVDAQRLGDALRSYLDEYGIRVQSAAASPEGDLRAQMTETRRAGQAWRAIAAVRVGRGDPGALELELIDLVTDKSLVVSLARPPRDEDLYRALALKIHAVLRATLSEQGTPAVETMPELARLVARPAPPPRRIALEAGYLALSFPMGGPTVQGLSLAGSFRARGWLELAAGTAALTSARTRGQDVTVDASLWPLFVTALFRIERGRFEGLAGPTALVARARISATSAMTPVQSPTELLICAGLAVQARLLLGAASWLYLGASASGVPLGQRYTVEGAPVLDTSRLQASASFGLGIGVR